MHPTCLPEGASALCGRVRKKGGSRGNDPLFRGKIRQRGRDVFLYLPTGSKCGVVWEDVSMAAFVGLSGTPRAFYGHRYA